MVADAAKEKFLEIFKEKYKQDGEAFFEQQKALFNNAIEQGEALQKCSPLSLMNAFMSLAINGLSLERTTTTDCYLQSRSVCVGKGADGKKVYAAQASIVISGYGELTLRKRAGQIKYADSPVLVYDCDKFSYGERDGHSVVDYMACFPRKPKAKLLAGFIKIVRPDNSYDYSIMTLEDVQRLMGYSSKNNRHWDGAARRFVEGGANELYGGMADGSGIDTGFFKAKIIKHAFKSFPRLCVGDGAVMQADDDNMKEDITPKLPEPFGETPAVQGVKAGTGGDDEGDEDGPF